MKKSLFVILAVIILLTGCVTPETNKTIKPDNIGIFYGFSSYDMLSTHQGVIDDLLNQFIALQFKKTTDEMDLGSAFHVNLSSNSNHVKRFRVDKNRYLGLTVRPNVISFFRLI